MRGEQAIPNITSPVYDAVATYGADSTGTNDSTVAIQNAIDAAEAAGGGVVYLQAGTYKISPQNTDSYSLRISESNVVLRGAGVGSTYLLNTETNMRSKDVIRVWPSSTSTGTSVSLTADLDGPTHRLPVTSASGFAVGDIVLIEWDFTHEWIAEHGQQNFWSEAGGAPAPARYYREVTAKSDAENWIEIDAPTRYTMKTRDNARVSKFNGMLTGVGLEGFSIANVQNAKTTWGESDYSTSGTGGYEAHQSYLVRLRYTKDCWIDDVDSFQPAGNSTTCHMLSNGILVTYAFRVTVQNCAMRRSQYGGGGGNGYMYRLQYASECLLKNCIADFNRHGFVTSHAGTSGNVFHQCEDRETKRSTGSTGSYQTSGSGSDNHMHFSHSNLWDSCQAHNSFFTASHRGNSGTIPHALTSAHGIYWNTSGSGTRYSNIVLSSQARYGYVIGTSGSQTGVSNPTSGNTAPADHVEGQGTGDQLEPASLYLDQVARRLAPTVTYKGNGHDGGNVPVDGNSPYATGATVTILGQGSMTRSGFSFEGWNTEPDGSGIDYAESDTLEIDNHVVLYAKWSSPNVVAVSANSIDQIIGIRQTSGPALDYYPDTAENLVGSAGSNGSRYTANLVMGYNLPTLPVGTTVDSAVFHFEITANRDMSGNNPSVQVHLLDVANPDASGDDHFFSGTDDANPDTHLIDDTYIAVGSTEATYADDEQDQSYTLSGSALDVLKSYYGGDHIPERSEVFLRFSLDLTADPNVSSLDRYRIDLASNESSFEVTAAPPFDIWAGGLSFGGDANGDGIADGLAWLLDSANPAADARSLLPTIQQSSGDLLSSFRMLKSGSRGTALLKLQYSKDLGVTDPWTNNTVTVPESSSTVDGVDFVISPAGADDYNDVDVTLPASAADGEGRLFMRLMAEP